MRRRGTGVALALVVLAAAQGTADAAPRAGAIRVPAQVTAPGPLRLAVPVLTGVPVRLEVLLSSDARVGPGDRRLVGPVLVRGSRTVRRTVTLPSPARPGGRRLLTCIKRPGGTRTCRASARFLLRRAPAGPPVPPPAGPVTPPAVAPVKGVPLGVAVWWGCVDPQFTGPPPLACRLPREEAYGPAALRFDRIVPENELKEGWVHPARGVWDFELADELVAWARANGKEVRGHTLVFGKDLPGWKARGPELLGGWKPAELRAELRDHILTTMRHYKAKFPGTIREWDVVNEAFAEDGSFAQNVYLRTLGKGYVEDAFRFAREADPDAVLVLNEFGADRPSSPRGLAVRALVRDFVARGVPIDAVGLQSHVATQGRAPTAEEYARQFADYAALGIDVQLTELDVGTSFTPDPALRLEEQRAVYRTAVGACAAAPNCTGTTVWGVADHHSWRGPEELATLLDPAFAPKPAWDDVRALLAGAAGGAR